MAEQKRPGEPILTGVDPARRDVPPLERLPATEVQREEGEAAERSAGNRGADVPGVSGGDEPPPATRE